MSNNYDVELAMVTTPLLTMLQHEAAGVIAREFLAHLAGCAVIYIDQ